MDFHKILSKLSALEGAPSTKALRESVEIRADGPEAMALLGHPEAGGSSSLPPPGDDFGFGNDGIGSNDLDDMADAALGGDTATDIAIDTVGNEGGDTSIGDLQRLSGLEPSMEEEADLLYANSPEEDIKPLAAAIPSGNDMHKEKGAYRSTALGDNPRAVTALENKLLQQWRAYLNESDKPKGEYYAEKDGDYWCVFHTEKSKCFGSFASKEAAQADAARRNKE